MLKVMARPSAPVTPKTPKKAATLTEKLMCSKVKVAVTPKKCLNPSPERDHGPKTLNLLPTQTVVSVLYGFARELLLNSIKRGLLTEKYLKKLDPEGKSTLVNSQHTVLTYMRWGINYVEQAFCSVFKEKRDGELLEKGEQMLQALTSMDTQGLSANDVTNAIIVSLAHLYLALVWKRRRNQKQVAAHLLEMFVVCPKDARQNIAPELWEQLFRPYLVEVETWYKRESSNLITSSGRSSSAVMQLSPSSRIPSAVGKAASAIDFRDLKLLGSDLSQALKEDRKHSEKIMQMNLLYDLYEQTLNESTQQYAQHYQELIISYELRIERGYKERDDMQLRKGSLDLSPNGGCTPRRSGATRMQHEYEINEGGKSISEAMSSPGGTLRPLQLRRSLYEAILGTFSIGNAKNRGNQGSFLRFCNNEQPQAVILDEQHRLSPEYSRHPVQKGGKLFHNRLQASLVNSNGRAFPRSDLATAHDNRRRASESKSKPDKNGSGSAWRLIDLMEASESEAPCSVQLEHSIDFSSSSTYRERRTSMSSAKEEEEEEGVGVPMERAGMRAKKATARKARRSSFSAAEEKLLIMRDSEGRGRELEGGRQEQLLRVNALPSLLAALDSPLLDESVAAASILTSCILADGEFRQLVVPLVQAGSVSSLLQGTACRSSAFSTAVDFVTQLLRTNRRRSSIETLRRIRAEGLLDIALVLMVHIRRASPEHRPVAAALLLQLDLAGDTNGKPSMFAEEALDTLVAALCAPDSTEANLAAARVLESIGGRFSACGKSEVELWLLKRAALEQATTRREEGVEEEREMMQREWERKAAGAVLGHGRAMVEALGKGLRSGMPEVRRACLVASAWLSCFVVEHDQQQQRELMRAGLQAEDSAIHHPILSALLLHNLATPLPKNGSPLLSTHSRTSTSSQQESCHFLHTPPHQL